MLSHLSFPAFVLVISIAILLMIISIFKYQKTQHKDLIPLFYVGIFAGLLTISSKSINKYYPDTKLNSFTFVALLCVGLIFIAMIIGIGIKRYKNGRIPEKNRKKFLILIWFVIIPISIMILLLLVPYRKVL